MENPAANAQTYTEEEFDEEGTNVLQGKQAKKVGFSLRVNIESYIKEDPIYEITLPEKIESTDQVQTYQKTVHAEIERIDTFLKKYEGHFRLRYKDGDLKVMTLTEGSVKKLTKLKLAWLEILQKLETHPALILPKKEEPLSVPDNTQV